jgi:hypothetical protein
LLLLPAGVTAQSLTSGGLTGRIVDERGTPVPGTILTLERENAATRELTATLGGRFALSGLTPGSYRILAEQVGYQPVRMSGIQVVAGRELQVTIRMERRPPPITSVTEVQWSGLSTDIASGDPISRDQLRTLDRRRDATDISRDFSRVATATDGRPAFTSTSNGLAPAASRLMVDGVEETLLRHPGWPGEGASAPLFARDGVSQGVLFGNPLDAEWRGATGATLGLLSERGGSRLLVEPFLTWSGASLAGAAIDNPADSSASSLQVGVAMSGPIKGDTAGWFIRVDHQRLATPTADPFTLGNTELYESVSAVAGDTPVSSWLNPTVRTFENTSGMARLDLRLNSRSRIGFRIGAASWQEENPIASQSLVNGAGSTLEASDLSAAAEFTTGGDSWTSETRLGVRNSSRDWLGAELGVTSLIDEGIAFGGAATLPGMFDMRVLEISEALQLPWGKHQLKLGGVALARTWNYDWINNGVGRSDYGSLAGFTAGIGSWSQANVQGAADDLSTTEFAVFAQDIWQITPTVRLIGGVRYEMQRMPQDAITVNEHWAIISGLRNDLPPRNRAALAPRGGLLWDVGGRGRTLVRASAGLVAGQHDYATMAEVARYDGDVTVDRATGEVGWGNPAEADIVTGTVLAMYDDEVRAPRAFSADFGVTTAVGAGTSISVEGAYRHTDYLLRRTDINRPAGEFATDQHGRPIYGELQQFGGLIVAAPGTNRRFEEFDHVYGIASSGFADYYEATFKVEHQVSNDFLLSGGYTYSKTRDNLVGQISVDPADRLSPFPDGLAGADWDEGRSDLDIPHRLALLARLELGTSLPVSLGARFRFQSGLPYTPGFRYGVDVNGDGSGGNDPAPASNVDGCDAGVSGFATRNACRAEATKALDLHAGLSINFAGRRLALMVDVFNLVSSEQGIVDRAAVLINPDGNLTSVGGEVTLPLITNENFGQLLSRRNDPRLLRIGLRLEN